jgi:acetyl-CoA C-acetyltransferase
MNKPEIFLFAPVRTPIGTYGGALKDTHATALGDEEIVEGLRSKVRP